MIVIGVGVNYVTEVFSFVGRSFSAGFDWYCTILERIGLPWQVFSLILIGFAVSYFLVSGVIGSYRDSADSVFSDSVQYSRRSARQAAFDRRTETMNENQKEILWNLREMRKKNK